MNIVDIINSKPEKIKRKLSNGFTEVKILFNDNNLSYHYFLDENDKKHGEYKSWWKDGTLSEHYYYENGELHGEYKSWYYNGTLWEHCYYEHGKRHGEYKGWWSNGTLREHCHYENGELIKNYLEDK